MHVPPRNRTFLALACLFTAAFVAQPLVAAAQTSPGTVLFARPMSGLYAGEKTITGYALFSIGDDGFGQRQLTPYAQYVYNVSALSNIPNYSENWLVNAFSPSGRYSLFVEAHSKYPLFGSTSFYGKFYMMNALGQRTKPLFSGSDDLESPRVGPSWGSVTWGPAGTNEIAFTNAADDRLHSHHACVRLMHPDGTGNHKLWCATRWDYRALQGVRWSGDGSKLLVYAVRSPAKGQDPNGVADLFLIDTATGAATLVQAATRPPYQNGTGDVSYDGHEVVYGVPYFAENPGSCTVPSDPYSVTWCAKNMLTGEVVPLVDPDNVVTFTSGGQTLISSDGSRAYLRGTANYGADKPDIEIYTINTDGTGLRQITQPCVPVNSGTSLWWKPVRLSPDGTRMLANCHVDQYPPAPPTSMTNIYVVNLADGSTRYVTRGSAYDWHVPSP